MLGGTGRVLVLGTRADVAITPSWLPRERSRPLPFTFTGILFVAALSVALGIASGPPKVFSVVSLALWYLALNARGRPSVLDYGGWWGEATAFTAAAWLAAALLAAGGAVVAHRVLGTRP